LPASAVSDHKPLSTSER
jgi:hypothetical protein